MRPDVQSLVALQNSDAKIAALNATLAAAPGRLAEAEGALKQADAALARFAALLTAEETTRRRLESDVKDQRQRIVKFRSQSDSVKNNEQYRALLHEIDFAEAEIRRLEDLELDSMGRTETLEADRKAAEEKVAHARARLEHVRAEASAASRQAQAELAAEKQTRAALRSGIPEDLLRNYDRIASTRRTALAEAFDQKCSACQMMLRPQRWNDVREGALVPCESCARLLYYDETHFKGGDGTEKWADKNEGSSETSPDPRKAPASVPAARDASSRLR